MPTGFARLKTNRDDPHKVEVGGHLLNETRERPRHGHPHRQLVELSNAAVLDWSERVCSGQGCLGIQNAAQGVEDIVGREGPAIVKVTPDRSLMVHSVSHCRDSGVIAVARSGTAERLDQGQPGSRKLLGSAAVIYLRRPCADQGVIEFHRSSPTVRVRRACERRRWPQESRNSPHPARIQETPASDSPPRRRPRLGERSSISAPDSASRSSSFIWPPDDLGVEISGLTAPPGCQAARTSAP